MTISIIGLGWLGLPLAEKLISKGHVLKGSTTRQDKQELLLNEGINAILFKLDPKPKGKDFESLFETDLLFINVPPSRRTQAEDFHPQQVGYLKQLAEKAGVKKIIFVSSTSVYPTENQIARENDLLDKGNTGNISIWEAENILENQKNYDLTVIRFGGLLGDDRVPGRYFSGKEEVAADPPVNYIHRTDAIRAVEWIMEKGLWNQTFNIVCPLHPSKKAVFEKNAKDLGFLPPKSYKPKNATNWKCISPEKFLNTGFKFQYENPLSFKYTAGEK